MSEEEIAVAACRPVRPEEYPPDRLKIWHQTIKELGLTPPLYPGSISQNCEGCGIEIAVGPKAQEALRTRPIVVMCMLCAVTEMAQPGVSSVVRDLGNRTFDPPTTN